MELPNVKCNKCNGLFNSIDIVVKEVTEYEDLEVCIFDCPICGQETDKLQCDDID